MAVINVAFSAGIESTYLIQKALEAGHTVNPCIINVSGNNDIFAMDVEYSIRILKVLKGMDGFKGFMNNLYLLPACPFPGPTVQSHEGRFLSGNVVQQINTVLGMLNLKRIDMFNHMPTVWIGWLKQDSSDFTERDYDFSPEDYMQFLDLPKVLGPLSYADRIGHPFKAPLWNMDKAHIYELLKPELKPLVIPNMSRVMSGEGSVYPEWFSGKKDEYKTFGIPLPEEPKLLLKDLSPVTRFLLGYPLPEDLDLQNVLLTPFKSLIHHHAFKSGRVLKLDFRGDLTFDKWANPIYDARNEILRIFSTIAPDKVADIKPKEEEPKGEAPRFDVVEERGDVIEEI